MKPLSIGLIGCGRATQDHHLPALKRVREVGVVALADPYQAALVCAGRRFFVFRWHADHRELLEDESIDAVCVAAPSELHTEIALDAIDAGKHVLVEKPLALSLADCDALNERAASAGVTGMVGFNLRWHRLVRRARAAIDSGEIGEPRLLQSVFASPSLLGTDIPEWRLDPGRGGGMLAMQAVHHLDLWSALLDDEVEQVHCTGFAGPGGSGLGSAAVSATTRGGVTIASAFCSVTGQENGFSVYGSEGWLSASLYGFDSFRTLPRDATLGDLGRHARAPLRFAAELARAAPSLRLGGDFAASYVLEWRHFVDAIRRDRAVECGFEAGREATRVLLAVLESARTGAGVRTDSVTGEGTAAAPDAAAAGA